LPTGHGILKDVIGFIIAPKSVKNFNELGIIIWILLRRIAKRFNIPTYAEFEKFIRFLLRAHISFIYSILRALSTKLHELIGSSPEFVGWFEAD